MVIYQNVVSTFNVCSTRTLSGCEPYCHAWQVQDTMCLWAGEQRSHESALLMPPSPNTF